MDWESQRHVSSLLLCKSLEMQLLKLWKSNSKNPDVFLFVTLTFIWEMLITLIKEKVKNNLKQLQFGTKEENKHREELCYCGFIYQSFYHANLLNWNIIAIAALLLKENSVGWVLLTQSQWGPSLISTWHWHHLAPMENCSTCQFVGCSFQALWQIFKMQICMSTRARNRRWPSEDWTTHFNFQSHGRQFWWIGHRWNHNWLQQNVQFFPGSLWRWQHCKLHSKWIAQNGPLWGWLNVGQGNAANHAAESIDAEKLGCTLN